MKNVVRKILKMSYCPVDSPFVRYRKIIMITITIILITGMILFITMPGIQEGFKQYGAKLAVENKKIKSIITLIIIIAMIVGLIVYLFYRTVIYRREQRCLQVYQLSSYPQIAMGKTPVKYQSPYFNREMPYLVHDFYILAAAKASLPCGQYRDLSTTSAIENVLERGARWVEFNVYWEPDNNMDKNPVGYFSTGDGQTPTHLIYNDNMLAIADGLKTCAKNAWKKTDAPLFICLQADKLLENGYLPSLFLEKKIAAAWAAAFYDRIPSPDYLGRKVELGSVPMPEAVNKVFLILNWVPQEERLVELTTDIVRKPDETYPQWGIQTVKLTPGDLPYGGIKAKFVSPDDMIEFNRFHMTRVVYEVEPSSNNWTSPKADIDNMDPMDSYKVGVQVVPQHFTVFPGKDNCFLRTLEFFKDGPLKLKPEELRYIPKPSEPIRKQFTELSYAPKEFKDSRPGFAQLQI